MFHVPLSVCQLFRGREEEGESMHGRLKIASVGSAIFSRSGEGGFMWLSKLAGASDEETDKTRNGWMRGVDGSVRER